jgi:hypothetical protein
LILIPLLSLCQCGMEWARVGKSGQERARARGVFCYRCTGSLQLTKRNRDVASEPDIHMWVGYRSPSSSSSPQYWSYSHASLSEYQHSRLHALGSLLPGHGHEMGEVGCISRLPNHNQDIMASISVDLSRCVLLIVTLGRQEAFLALPCRGFFSKK